MAGSNKLFILILSLFCYFFIDPCHSETDTLQQGQQLKDWDYLISSNKVFTLKFFGFGTTINPYLGIFYNKNHNLGSQYLSLAEKAVWVANRNDPIPDTSSKFMIDVHGKLTILSSTGTILDLFNPSPVTHNASGTLLDSGNFVLQELYPDGSIKRVLWQSFDYPTDTLLPGMKLGISLETGHRWSLTSWMSDQLPAHGSFTLTTDLNGTEQLIILRRGKIYWKSGPLWNGQFQNAIRQSSGTDVRLYYISNETEKSTYITKTYDYFPSLKIYEAGWIEGSIIDLSVSCGMYNGPGCVENDFQKLKCRKYFSQFAKLNGYVYGDGYEYDESYNLTLYDCKRICWNDCSCTAYSYETKNRASCKTYSKMTYNPAKSDWHTQYYAIVTYRGKKNTWIWLIIGIGSLAPILSCYLVDKKLRLRVN